MRSSEERTWPHHLYPRWAATGLVIMAIAGATAGCSNRHVVTGSVPTDGYRTNHPIVISEVPETMDIPVGRHSGNLSPAMRSAIVEFADSAQTHGNGSIRILAPSGSANESAALFVTERVEKTLINAGVPRHRISRHAYSVENTRAVAPVRLAYARIKAVVHKCGLWPEQMTARNRNDGYSEFGCSTQSNLAAMVSNPADLLYPRGSDPSDPMRRNDVYEKYRKGQDPATDYNGNEGEVSDVKG